MAYEGTFSTKRLYSLY